MSEATNKHASAGGAARPSLPRKTYSQRLGEFCKQLRDIVDGKAVEVDELKSREFKSGERTKQGRLPYADQD